MQINLPIVVCGKKIDGKDRDKVVIKSEDGLIISMPLLNEKDVDEIIASRLKTGLHETHFDDITVFFKKMAMFWLKSSNTLRDEAVKYCSLLTGYPESVVLRDYMLLVQLYAERGQMYDQLDTELGNRWYIDEWVPTQTCLVHAQPRGLVTNILVGNIPLASAFGIFRSLIVKNNTLCKLPKKDLISALYFALSFIEISPNHPITRSLTVAYWEKDSWQEERLLSASDAVCLWGGETAINEIRKKTKMGTKILEYGPKRSMSIIDLDSMEPQDNLDDIALRAAHDFSIYNQEACFTSQDMYIRADDCVFKRFLAAFETSLRHYLSVYPKGKILDDNKAHVLITRNEQLLKGAKVIAPENHDWTIIIAPDEKRLPNHPLSRTVVIHRVNNLTEAVDSVDSYTQTVCVFPWKQTPGMREELTLKGVERIAGIGLANFPRTGFPHDGIWTFNELVKWVSVERDIDFKGKYYDNSKEEFVNELFRAGQVIKKGELERA